MSSLTSRVQAKHQIISRRLSLTNLNFQYAGIYEALLVWNMSEECAEYYRELRVAVDSHVILARSSIELRYYGECYL